MGKTLLEVLGVLPESPYHLAKNAANNRIACHFASQTQASSNGQHCFKIEWMAARPAVQIFDGICSQTQCSMGQQ
jgi:hypothetical protein